jgi:hypothetical protein
VERWTYLIIPDDGGDAKQVRIFLRAGDDPAEYPSTQVNLDGTEVPVDDIAHDYEAPEWKAKQILAAGGTSDSRFEDIKDDLRRR